MALTHYRTALGILVCLVRRPPPRSTRTHTVLPYATSFRCPLYRYTSYLMSCSPIRTAWPTRPATVMPPTLALLGSASSGVWVHSIRQTGSRIGSAFLADASSTVTRQGRSEEHMSELQSLMRISYAVICLKKKPRQT